MNPSAYVMIKYRVWNKSTDDLYDHIHREVLKQAGNIKNNTELLLDEQVWLQIYEEL